MNKKKSVHKILSLKNIGKKLKLARIESGIKRSEVELKTGIPSSTLFQYENGISKSIPANIVLKLAILYKKPIHHFYSWAEVTTFTTLTSAVIGSVNGIYPLIFMTIFGFSMGYGVRKYLTNRLTNLYNTKSFDKIENSVSDDKKHLYQIVKDGIIKNWNLDKLYTPIQLKSELSFLLSYYLSHLVKEDIIALEISDKNKKSKKNDEPYENIINKTTHVFNYNKLGERLKDIRNKKGLTIKEVSELIDIPIKTISKYENGGTKNISDDTLKLFSTVYQEDFSSFNILSLIPLFGTFTGLVLMLLFRDPITGANLIGFFFASIIGTAGIKSAINKYSHKTKDDILSSLDPDKVKSYNIMRDYLYLTWKTKDLFTKEEIEYDENFIFSIFLGSIIKEENLNNDDKNVN